MKNLLGDHYSKNEGEKEGNGGREKGGGRREGDMQFAATEHNVEPIFLYKDVKSNKADNNKGSVNLIRRMKKDNDSQRQIVTFMTL